MKRMALLIMLTMFLLSGCGSAEPEVTEAVATLPEVTVVELAETTPATTVTETTEPEIIDETVWLPVYYTDKGKAELHCLVKNETMGNLSVESMRTEYYLNGEVIKEHDYDKKALKGFLWRPFNELDLSIAASTLLIVDDCLSEDGFDHALITIATQDEQGTENVLTYNFTMDEAEVTPSTLTDNWELSTSWLVDEFDGWNWDHCPVNTTDDILELEVIHSVGYDNGIPVTAGSKTPKEYSNYIETVKRLIPGQSAKYTEGVTGQHRNYNQREVTYIYRNSDGEPYLQKFFFVYEDALLQEEYSSLTSVAALLEMDAVKNGLGPMLYSKEELQKMVDENLSLEEVAKKISTLGDLVQFLNLRGYKGDGRGDLKFWEDGKRWHLNRSSQVVYNDNSGNCGGGSNLVNYILQGDYDEQGYVHEAGIGGGHIYNWFKENGVYYFFDLTVCSLFETEDPSDFSDYYVSRSHKWYDEATPFYIRLQYMYERNDVHLALGDLTGRFMGGIPEEIEGDAWILYADGKEYEPMFIPGPLKEKWPAEAQ